MHCDDLIVGEGVNMLSKGSLVYMRSAIAGQVSIKMNRVILIAYIEIWISSTSLTTSKIQI